MYLWIFVHNSRMRVNRQSEARNILKYRMNMGHERTCLSDSTKKATRIRMKTVIPNLLENSVRVFGNTESPFNGNIRDESPY